jgi:hypothetical protein
MVGIIGTACQVLINVLTGGVLWRSQWAKYLIEFAGVGDQSHALCNEVFLWGEAFLFNDEVN